MQDKVILVDCDGVLLDWEFQFDLWMAKHGYEICVPGEYKMSLKYGIPDKEMTRLIRMFNESAAIRKLPPLRDAIKYVKKLHADHGYIFYCISSLSDDEYAQRLRTKNLIETFGPTVFHKYIYLDTGADKNVALEKFKNTGCYWIEDKPENADVGASMGLKSILMRHDHNVGYNGTAIKVNNWKDIYQIVVG